MGEAGVFAPDARLELIEGEIFEMAPIHPPHSGAGITLTRILVERAGDRAAVSVQNPVIASELSVPQPDFVLLKPRRDNYSTTHPRRGDILLVIEVADTTLAADLGIKVPLYARGGIAEAWVVDVNARAVHVFRGPGANGYHEALVARGEDRLTPAALPMLSLRVAEIFPT
jgi:Uma2 family endonuclease